MSELEARTILIGWELGAGRGHLVRLVPIIAALRTAGCKVVVAMRDVPAAREVFAEIGKPGGPGSFMLGQAPIFQHQSTTFGSLYSMPEILLQMGFADPEKVKPVVVAWSALIDRFKPALVIADTAPSLIAAARKNVATLAIGNGWSIPPAGISVPPLPVFKHDSIASILAEDRICATFNQVLKPASAITNLAELLRADECIVCTPPILDPYRSYRVESTFWPPELPLYMNDEEVSFAKPIRIYLPACHPAIRNLDQSLALLNLSAEGYFQGARPLGLKRIKTFITPFDFGTAAATAACIVHQGGTGVAAYAMAYGTPQIIMPVDLEKTIAAAAMEAEYRCTTLSPSSNVNIISQAIVCLLKAKNLKALPLARKGDSDKTMATIRKKCGIADAAWRTCSGARH